MSLCGTIGTPLLNLGPTKPNGLFIPLFSSSRRFLFVSVVVKKKRKRKTVSNDDSDSDDSSSPLSYTYTNCDSCSILEDNEHQRQQWQYRSPIDDEESSTPPPFQWLNWRMDPIKTFSDWKIDVIIVHRRSNTTSNIVSRQYHVHKNVLVVESQFFQSLFLQQRHSQKASMLVTTTKITVSNEYEANAFPTFLDYIYSPGSVWITQQNAITMLLLSKYFGMNRLQWLTKRFLKQNQSELYSKSTKTSDDVVTTKPIEFELDGTFTSSNCLIPDSANLNTTPSTPLGDVYVFSNDFQKPPTTSTTKHHMISSTSSSTSHHATGTLDYDTGKWSKKLSKQQQHRLSTNLDGTRHFL
jgi:BTB/POZ domain